MTLGYLFYVIKKKIKAQDTEELKKIICDKERIVSLWKRFFLMRLNYRGLHGFSPIVRKKERKKEKRKKERKKKKKERKKKEEKRKKERIPYIFMMGI